MAFDDASTRRPTLVTGAHSIDSYRQQFRQGFVEQLLGGGVFIAVAGALVSVARAHATGWLSTYAIHIGLAVLVISLFLARRRLSDSLKSKALVVLFAAVGLSSVFQLGILGAGVWWLALSVILVHTLFSSRAALIGALMVMVVIVSAGVLFLTETLKLGFDANTYLLSPASWINVVLGVIVMPFIIFRAIGTWRNTTDLLLNELETFYEAINHEYLISAAGPDGRIIMANDEFVKLSGYTREELLGQDHRIVSSGKHPPEFWKAMWNTVTSGKRWRNEVCNQTKSQSFYWVDSLIAPFRGPSGKIERYVSVRTDITARKRAEAELAVMSSVTLEQNRRLQEYQRETQAEMDLATQIFKRMLSRCENVDAQMKIMVSSLSVFSGDAVFAARTKAGVVRVMVADVSGHGLTAALGTLSLSSLFYSSVARDESLETAVEVVNRELAVALPAHLFAAAVAFELDRAAGTLRVINAGMPNVFILSREGALREYASNMVPLGITKHCGCSVETIQVKPDDTIVVMTDGIIEQPNGTGELFGLERVRQTLQAPRNASVLESLTQAVREFSSTQADDTSLLEIKV